MKHVLLGLVAMFSAFALAQSPPQTPAPVAPAIPQTEFFVGYSGVRYAPTLRGWTGSATHNLSRRLGLAAEVSGGYGSFRQNPAFGNGNVWSYNVLVGPTLSLYRGHSRKRQREVTTNIFTHALVGMGITRDMGPTLSEVTHKSWASAMGGGYEVHFTKMIGVRVGGDWLHQNAFNTNKNTFRGSVGVVFALPASLP